MFMIAYSVLCRQEPDAGERPDVGDGGCAVTA
jgi:hypothetical protein